MAGSDRRSAVACRGLRRRNEGTAGGKVQHADHCRPSHLIEWGVTQFTDGAASVDLQNPPIGGLAKSWEASPDGKHYTFHLRSDAKSPFGNTVSTDDVVWSFQRAKELKSVGL